MSDSEDTFFCEMCGVEADNPDRTFTCYMCRKVGCIGDAPLKDNGCRVPFALRVNPEIGMCCIWCVSSVQPPVESSTNAEK